MSSEARAGRARHNVELFEQGLAAFAEQGAEALVELLDPEVEIHSSPELANAGDFHGVGGYKRWTARWFDAWDEYELYAELIEPVGDRHVVASCRQQARGRASGAEVEMKLAYMVEVDADHIRRFHLYPTRTEALAEARRGEAERG
jgi:hypothetical protein